MPAIPQQQSLFDELTNYLQAATPFIIFFSGCSYGGMPIFTPLVNKLKCIQVVMVVTINLLIAIIDLQKDNPHIGIDIPQFLINYLNIDINNNQNNININNSCLVLNYLTNHTTKICLSNFAIKNITHNINYNKLFMDNNIILPQINSIIKDIYKNYYFNNLTDNFYSIIDNNTNNELINITNSLL